MSTNLASSIVPQNSSYGSPRVFRGATFAFATSKCLVIAISL